MAHRVATGLILMLTAATLAVPANAVVMGSMSSLGSYTVRLVGNGYCSGVVIARRVVATAAHCAYGMHVLTDSGSIRVAGITRSALLDDGRRVSVSGDGAFLRLAAPLPSGVGPAPVGEGHGDTFTIAGYGTMTESETAAFGSLHEATLVAAGARALVDPHRGGRTGASACFGDSGGPVMRGGVLVGVITRAAHPSPRIACGDLTRWTPITVSGSAKQVAAVADTADRRGNKAPRHAQESETASFSLFGNWFSEKVETRRSARRSARHKSAER
jgi:hypothetical protein